MSEENLQSVWFLKLKKGFKTQQMWNESQDKGCMIKGSHAVMGSAENLWAKPPQKDYGKAHASVCECVQSRKTDACKSCLSGNCSDKSLVLKAFFPPSVPHSLLHPQPSLEYVGNLTTVIVLWREDDHSPLWLFAFTCKCSWVSSDKALVNGHY